MADELLVRRIDVAIDGSREAAAALLTAARLALALGAGLRLVAVAEPRSGRAGEARPSDPTERRRLARHLAQAVDDLPGLRVETELREGPPDEVIQGLAGESDLLVLGSRTTYGATGLTALGSVAARIMHGAPCPVMIAPAP